MQLYSANTREFIAEARDGRIAGTLRDNYRRAFQAAPNEGEVRSWQASLAQVAEVIDQAGLHDNGILLEYQLPLSSKRLDCMITGRGPGGRDAAVVVELKQWEHTEPSNLPDCVVAFIGKRSRDMLHPSRQVGQYCQYLADASTAFSDGSISLEGCAFLHNAPGLLDDPLFGDEFAGLLGEYPLFTGAGRWTGHPGTSHDSLVKRWRDGFVDLVKNTYRVLRSRGIRA